MYQRQVRAPSLLAKSILEGKESNAKLFFSLLNHVLSDSHYSGTWHFHLHVKEHSEGEMLFYWKLLEGYQDVRK